MIPSQNAIYVAKILIEAEVLEWNITVEEAVEAVKFLQRMGLLEVKDEDTKSNSNQ